jgi:hypothetical protein
MSTTSFRAIVVISDGSAQEKGLRDIADVRCRARWFGCCATEIGLSGNPSLGVYSFMIPPAPGLHASESQDAHRAFLAWLGEAIDPGTSPIRYAEVVFDGEQKSTVLERHSADGLGMDCAAAPGMSPG